jgi:hypothetical protein
MARRCKRPPDMLRDPPLLHIHRTVLIKGQPIPVKFPDVDHFELYKYGATLDPTLGGNAQRCSANGRRIYGRFKRWLVGSIECREQGCRIHVQPNAQFADANELALDYVEAVHDLAVNPVHLKLGFLAAPLFVDPDYVADWWQEKAEQLFALVYNKLVATGKCPRSPVDQSSHQFCLQDFDD